MIIDVRTKFKLVILLTIFSIFLCVVSILKIPQINGDGREYYMMAQSFYNHGTPEIQKSDIDTIRNNLNLSDYMQSYLYGDKVPLGYYFSNDNKLYSFHFFAYSLFSVPIKYILNIFGENDLKSFQILNTLLFVLMIWIVYKKIKFEDTDKLYLLIFLIFNPIVYYFDWTHPEVFTYVFVVISLLYFYNKNYKTSFIFMAIASWQNPPVLIFSIFVFVYNTITNFKERKFKSIILEGFCISIALLPMIFYYYNFGVFNLIAAKGYSSFSNVSLLRIYDLFFSFAHGMVLFYPFIIFIFLYLVVKNILLKNIENYIYIFSIFIMIIMMTTTSNWNSGMEFVVRYSIWLYPFIIFYVINYIDKNYIKIITYSHMIFFILVFIFYKDFSYLKFNKLSEYILNNIPSLYITTDDTFMENVLNKESQMKLPIVYINKENLQVTKILTDLNGLNEFEKDVTYTINQNWLNEIKKRYSNEKSPFFVNVPRNYVVCSSIIFGKKYFANYEGNNSIFLTKGWARGEENFTWSNNKKVTLVLPLDLTILNSELKLTFKGFPFISEKNKLQKYSVSVNGVNIGGGVFDKMGDYTFDIPKNILSSNILTIELFLPDATKSDSNRELAFGLMSFVLDKK